MTKKIFLKFGVFIVLILLVIIPFKTFKKENEKVLNLKENDTVLIFIGSSRIKKSINPYIISKKLKLKKTYNFGINNATFNHNLEVANYIIKQKGVKRIVFELSPDIDNLSIDVIKGFNEIDPNFISLKSILKKSSFSPYHFKNSTTKLNNYLYTKISILEDFKEIFNVSSPNHIGYISEEKNNYKTIETFLKKEDYAINSENNLQTYLLKLDELLLLASKNNTSIKFIVPLNYNQEKERKIVFSLFNSLEKKHTIRYSDQFIQKITKSEYLHDKFHFNSKGATMYSNLLSEKLKNWD